VNAPGRGRAYLELPDEQLTASTPAEFAQILNRIMTAAGLRASEVAIKAKIPRSQAYNMVAASRTTLPGKREQVSAFLAACGLAPVQTGLVMDLWTKLDQQAREQAANPELSPDGKDVISDAANSTVSQTFYSDVAAHGATFGTPSRRRATRGTASYRPGGLIDLLFLVIEDDDRTRRALLLLLPLAIAAVVIVASLTTWAILQPGRAPMIGAILAGGFALPLATIMKYATRTIRR
jgi:hypothetical protein